MSFRLLRMAPLALIALVPLAGCGTTAADIRGPKLTAINYPAKPIAQPPSLVAPREATPQPASANSLWQSGARAFFNDQRASRVGDILTVQISIDDSAKVSNATTRKSSSSTKNGATKLAGLETNLSKLLPGAPDTSTLFDFGGDTASAGQGSVDRAEKINTTMAAVVTAVMPNGNLIIQGSQEVRTNAEVRELTVAGIVRPQDISSTNTIRNSQIAEARISYGGRGDISRIQKSPAGQALVERFSPF